VLVPFGGGDHDWAAVEVGAWIASALGRSLTLTGTVGERDSGRRDASRLACQRVADGLAPRESFTRFSWSLTSRPA
jgi:hypothetical protein